MLLLLSLKSRLARTGPGRLVVAGGLVLAVALAACSSPSGGSQTTSGPSHPGLATAKTFFCRDIVAIGGGAVERPPAIARLLPKLRRDAGLYRRAGDTTDSARILAFAAALARVRAAGLGNGNPAKANAAAQEAAARLPSC